MKKTDYACLKNYSIKTLLACEIGSMPYYLFKNGQLRKAKKSELMYLEKSYLFVCPSKVLSSSMIVAVIVHFMGNARKVPNNKLDFRTYHDLASHL